MGQTPPIPKRLHKLVEAAQEARRHAARCGWPYCTCPEAEPGKIICPSTGATIHFPTPSDPDA